jgi:hypothetical protein
MSDSRSVESPLDKQINDTPDISLKCNIRLHRPSRSPTTELMIEMEAINALINVNRQHI